MPDDRKSRPTERAFSFVVTLVTFNHQGVEGKRGRCIHGLRTRWQHDH
jgi:hypothetical protein